MDKRSLTEANERNTTEQTLSNTVNLQHLWQLYMYHPTQHEACNATSCIAGNKYEYHQEIVLHPTHSKTYKHLEKIQSAVCSEVRDWQQESVMHYEDLSELLSMP